MSLSFWACSSTNTTEKVNNDVIIQEEVSENVEKTTNSTGLLSGVWKVVDFKDSLNTIHPDTIASAKTTFLSSYYTFTNDSVYSVRNTRIPKGDKGKWDMQKQEVGYYITFLSDQEKYKDAYQMIFLDENTMQWVKVIPNLGKYAMLVKKQ